LIGSLRQMIANRPRRFTSRHCGNAQAMRAGRSASQDEGRAMPLDRFDRKILGLLQEDATLSLGDLAERIGLSTTPCWRRVQRLEADGHIVKRVALLIAAKLNVGVTVFVQIKTSQHNQAWLERFRKVVLGIPEIVELYRMSGAVDYLMRVVVPDIAAYDAVYQRLIKNVEMFDVSSSFAMEQVKYTTALPLDYLD
jgi:Lrp/AsnC family transcriptional regulator